jgi:1-acyl-sn-glycerol-3-phosphate acyltransferase
VSLLRAAGRVAALVLVVIGGIGVALSLPLLGPASRTRTLRIWFRAVVRSVGVGLVASGPLATDGTVLVASNHLSWLDIPAILAVKPMNVVAKSEIRGWPVLGFMVAQGGTIFIDRTRLRSLPGTVGEIAGNLRQGESVLVFPQGSTWCGRTEGPYYPATLQAAIDAGVPVRPITLRYRLDDRPTTIAAWVGKDTLIASVWRIARTRGLTVRVEAAALIDPAAHTRREIAVRAKGPANRSATRPVRPLVCVPEPAAAR